MEENFTETTPSTPEPEKTIILTEEAQYYLQIAAKWGNFVAIVGFVGCGLMLLGGLFAGSFIASMNAMSPNPMPGSMSAFIGIFYIIIALISFMPCLYLYQFSSNAKKGVLFLSTDYITASISKLKSLFKFYGILVIVILSFYALVFIGALIGISTYSAFRQ